MTSAFVPRPHNLQSALDSYMEAAKCWKDHLALHQCSFAEHYREGRATLIYQLELSMFAADPDTPFRAKLNSPDTVFPAFAVLRKYMLDDTVLQVGDEPFMFINDVELVEGEKSIAVPSLIRLNLVKDQGTDADEERLVWSFSKKLFEQVPAGIDWELFLPFRYRLPANFSPHVVQCRSQVVQGITESQVYRKREFLGEFNPYEVVRRISATINANSIETSITKGLEVRIKLVDVLLGPFEL